MEYRSRFGIPILRIALLNVFFLSLNFCDVSSASAHANKTAAEPPIHRSQQLSDSFFLAWTADLQAEKITFSVTAKTRGYVGFGISYNGNMKGSDIVVGGVKDDGTPYLSDRFAESLTIPLEDKKQDWFLISASENETHTMISFYRSFQTCDDEHDIPIIHDTLHMIWSIGDSDDLKYHTERGGSQVNFLDPPIPPTEKLDSWDFRVSSNVPTEKDTNYCFTPDNLYVSVRWCTVHRAPKFAKKAQILGFEVILDGKDALQYTHHLILRKCEAPRGFSGSLKEQLEPWVGHAGGDCYQRQLLHIKGLCTANIYVWAKGGNRLIFPEHVGFPISETEDSEYYVVETHYDNPKLTKDIHYHTGVKVFYTETPRPLDAGFLYIGHEVDSSITVPPNKKNWEIVGHCSPECTQEKFPEDGINIFNVLLHSHLNSRRIKLRHFRKDEELPWIAYDKFYDFNFQQSRPLRKEVNVKKGDQMTVECHFDTTWKRPLKAVTGGLSSNAEMCEAWAFYWPRMPQLDICTSIHGNFKNLLNRAGIKKVSTELDQYNPIVESPESLKGMTYTEVLSNHVNWTEEFSQGFQDDLVTSDQGTLCVSYADYATPAAGLYDDNPKWPRANYPKLRKEYQPPVYQCTAAQKAETEVELEQEEEDDQYDEVTDETTSAPKSDGVTLEGQYDYD